MSRSRNGGKGKWRMRLKLWKRLSSKNKRARIRYLMGVGRWDDIHPKYDTDFSWEID